MNISFSMFGVDEKTCSAPAFTARQAPEIVGSLARIMRAAGMTCLQLDLTDNGAVPLMGMRYNIDSRLAAPEEIVKVQTSLLRSMMYIMSIYGVSVVTVAYDDVDIHDIKSYWAYVLTGDNQLLVNTQFENLAPAK